MINWILGAVLLIILVFVIRYVRKKGACDCGCSGGSDCPHCHMDGKHK